MNTKTDNPAATEEAVEELRRAYWHLVNVCDQWRYHDDARLALASFRLHDGVQIVGGVLQRHLDLLAAGDLESEGK